MKNNEEKDPISNLSHKIKGAMTAIKGAVDLLLMDDSFPVKDRREILTIARINIDKTIKLLNDLVDECKKSK
ncbi:MAG: histidine kinase dimerization/phospho-acceptor domain-containing protein [bacterium]